MPAVNGLLLAFDVGNTNTVIGLFDGKHLTRHWRLTTAAERTSDEYGILMWSLFQAVGHAIPKVSGVIVASVVPPLTSTVEALSQDYFGTKALVVGPGIKTGMPILYENPARGRRRPHRQRGGGLRAHARARPSSSTSARRRRSTT